MRRGELSMEVIVIAALALLVLVILAVLVIRSGVQANAAQKCESLGGECRSSCGPGEARTLNACGEDQECCIPFDEP